MVNVNKPDLSHAYSDHTSEKSNNKSNRILLRLSKETIRYERMYK